MTRSILIESLLWGQGQLKRSQGSSLKAVSTCGTQISKNFKITKNTDSNKIRIWFKSISDIANRCNKIDHKILMTNSMIT